MPQFRIVALAALLVLPSPAFAVVGAPPAVAWTGEPVRIDRAAQSRERLPPRPTPVTTVSDEKSSAGGNSSPSPASSPRSP